jgi:hypothetical protein
MPTGHEGRTHHGCFVADPVNRDRDPRKLHQEQADKDQHPSSDNEYDDCGKIHKLLQHLCPSLTQTSLATNYLTPRLERFGESTMLHQTRIRFLVGFPHEGYGRPNLTSRPLRFALVYE